MKKFNQKLYTKQKWSYDRKNHQHYIVSSNDNTLFADAIYETKIKKDDLPDCYIYGRYYKLWGYLSASGVKDLYYKKCKIVPESFKDDNLYVSYTGKLNKEAINNYDYKNQNYDYIVDGIFIFDYINYILLAEEYKNTEIYSIALNIKKELDEKHKEIKREYKR